MDGEEGDYVEQEAEESSADEEDDSEDSEEEEEGEEEGDSKCVTYVFHVPSGSSLSFLIKLWYTCHSMPSAPH